VSKDVPERPGGEGRPKKGNKGALSGEKALSHTKKNVLVKTAGKGTKAQKRRGG